MVSYPPKSTCYRGHKKDRRLIRGEPTEARRPPTTYNRLSTTGLAGVGFFAVLREIETGLFLPHLDPEPHGAIQDLEDEEADDH